MTENLIYRFILFSFFIDSFKNISRFVSFSPSQLPLGLSSRKNDEKKWHKEKIRWYTRFFSYRHPLSRNGKLLMDSLVRFRASNFRILWLQFVLWNAALSQLQYQFYLLFGHPFCEALKNFMREKIGECKFRRRMTRNFN